MLIVTSVPAVVNRTIISCMTNIIHNSILVIYKGLAYHNDKDVDALMESLHMNTDIELLGAMLSDVEEMDCTTSKALRVSFSHLKEALQNMNLTLRCLDTHLNKEYWFYNTDKKILDDVKSSKEVLDHCFARFIQILCTKNQTIN